MKKVSILAIVLSLALLIPAFNALAEDVGGQIAALQQRAERVQTQMNEVKQQCGTNLDGQIKSLNVSLENLVKQRVQLGSQISQLEAQMQDLKSSALASCGRNVKHYEDELNNIKQQMSALEAKKAAENAQKVDAPIPQVSTTAAAPASTPVTPVAPAQQGATHPRPGK